MEAFIVGSGMCVPERVVTNEEIAERLGLEPEYIFKLSGIRRRRWAPLGMTTSSLASAALHQALEDAELQPHDIDYLLMGTMTPDRFIPGSASAVQKSVGLREIPCVDIRAACCNMLYGLQLASALIISGAVMNVAICVAEIQSSWLDLTPTAGTTSMLFGDGAAALVVSGRSKTGSLKIIDTLLATNGTYLDDLGIRRPGTEFGIDQDETTLNDYRPRMVGQSVILQASRKMKSACQTLLQRNGLTIADVRWLVPHQANANLLDQLARNMNFDAKRGTISVLEDLGNTSSASMGIALDTLRRSAIKPGEYVLLPAFAAGFTWGAGLCHSL